MTVQIREIIRVLKRSGHSSYILVLITGLITCPKFSKNITVSVNRPHNLGRQLRPSRIKAAFLIRLFFCVHKCRYTIPMLFGFDVIHQYYNYTLPVPLVVVFAEPGCRYKFFAQAISHKHNTYKAFIRASLKQA